MDLTYLPCAQEVVKFPNCFWSNVLYLILFIPRKENENFALLYFLLFL